MFLSYEKFISINTNKQTKIHEPKSGMIWWQKDWEYGKGTRKGLEGRHR
jgi:hypothetical protein